MHGKTICSSKKWEGKTINDTVFTCTRVTSGSKTITVTGFQRYVSMALSLYKLRAAGEYGDLKSKAHHEY